MLSWPWSNNHQLTEMARSRAHADIKAVLLTWGAEILANIQEVSIDLPRSYRDLVQRLMLDADIVTDRFHVMKLGNTELHRARIQCFIFTDTA